MEKSSDRARPQRRVPLAKDQAKSRKHSLLRAEEQVLRSIANQVELREILDEICRALDIQIGDVVSFIALPGDPAELATVVMKATLYGLSTFCSENVVAENKGLLGTLEMYCSGPRSPSAGEQQLIAGAKRLAALAITRDMETGRGHSPASENRPVPRHFHSEITRLN
jgi:hypothetical protein